MIFNNINKVIGAYEQALGDDLRNRERLRSVRDVYEGSLKNMPQIVLGTIAEHRRKAKGTGTTSVKPDPQELKSHILDMLFKDADAGKRLFLEPGSVHEDGNPYGDGLRLLTAQAMGQALHQTVSTIVHEAKSNGDLKPYIEPLIDVAEDVRKTLAYIKPIPNSFRRADTTNHQVMHVLGQVIKSYDPGKQAQGDSVIPVELARNLAMATYAGNPQALQERRQQMLAAGWGVDPELEDLPDSPMKLPFVQEWFENFYGEGQAPADFAKYGLTEEVRPNIRQGVYGEMDGYPVGMLENAAPDGVPEGFRIRQQQMAAKEAESMRQFQAEQERLESKFNVFEKPMGGANASTQNSEQKGQSQSGGSPAGPAGNASPTPQRGMGSKPPNGEQP